MLTVLVEVPSPPSGTCPAELKEAAGDNLLYVIRDCRRRTSTFSWRVCSNAEAKRLHQRLTRFGRARIHDDTMLRWECS